MKIRRLKSCQGGGRTLVFSLLLVLALSISAGKFVVADSITRAPLSAASVFNRSGQLLGVTNASGVTPFIGNSEYPLTVRYLGFKEKEVAGNDTDTVFLEKSMTELPEVVESKKNNLPHISFNIESRGRGRRMFMFNRQGQPFYVTTYTEVYILDKEYISAKEAKKWEKRKLQPEDNVILVPSWAPELSPSTLALIGRVEEIDPDKVRLASKPDENLLRQGIFLHRP